MRRKRTEKKGGRGEQKGKEGIKNIEGAEGRQEKWKTKGE